MCFLRITYIIKESEKKKTKRKKERKTHDDKTHYLFVFFNVQFSRLEQVKDIKITL